MSNKLSIWKNATPCYDAVSWKLVTKNLKYICIKIWIGWRTTQGVPVLEDQPTVCKNWLVFADLFYIKTEKKLRPKRSYMYMGQALSEAMYYTGDGHYRKEQKIGLKRTWSHAAMCLKSMVRGEKQVWLRNGVAVRYHCQLYHYVQN